MAADYFTHLGVAFMNPGGRRSGTGTESSVSEIVNNETDELLQQANEEGLWKMKAEGFKGIGAHIFISEPYHLPNLCTEQSFRRDGIACLLTGHEFKPFNRRGVRPALAHVVPNSVHGKPDTLKCIAMFGGAITRDVVMNHLNSIGNVMNMELNAHGAYDNSKWGIEAEEEGGEVKYFFRTNPTVPQKRGPGFITLREGDEIQFGRGREGEQLNKGPIPRLCNLQLAVARVMKMSGAADIILEWKRQADDEGFPRLFISPRSSVICWMPNSFFLAGLWLHTSVPISATPPSATAPPSTTAPYFVFGSAPPSRP
ncbi:hypothetical protein BJV74DRAFT_841160 [Russula compacta]|nr:hypothetical protein BJV74DRAFT_841160 [Russula compacta]